MSIDPKIQEALTGVDSLAKLRSLIENLQAQGQDQQGILDMLERARQQCRETGREKEEDVIMEVMDFLIGWCSPHVKMNAKSS